MHALLSVPLNALTWTWGALAMYVFTFKSWRSYQRTKNPLAQMYYRLGLPFGTALLFFGLPGLLTQDLHVLRYTYFLGDFFVQISLQFQAWLLWFLGLRSHVQLKYLLACTIPFSLVLISAEVLTSQVRISQSPHLIIDFDKPFVLVLKSIIYLSIAIPLGYFLLKQAPHQTTLRAKIKSFTSGMIFIAISLAATSNNILDKGSDTVQSTASVAIFFTIFLLAQLLRPASSA
jgi:hypothetical protein